jgi:PAS domain S-box-containing protein
MTSLLILALSLVSPDAGAQTAVETPRTIRVVMDNLYAPFVFRSDDGRLQGILIDQWQAWEKKTGIKAEIHAMDWGEALRRMRAGEFDVIDSIVETPERQAYFDFTPAYATIEASIFFRRDIAGITDLASLKGFPVGVKAGDQHVDTLRENGVTTVIPFQNNDAIIEAAKQHKINVLIADDPSALYLLNKMGIEAEFRHSAPIFRDELRRAVRKGEAALLRTVSEGFAAIEPGELKRIDEKWFGRTINRIGRYLTYSGYGAAVAVLLIAGLVGWNRTLRKGILERTAALGESEQRFRQIAENIHESERRLAQAQGVAHVGYWERDLDTGGIIWSDEAYRIFGLQPQEPIESFEELIHPEDRPVQVEATGRALGGEHYNVEYRVVRPNGEVRLVHSQGDTILDESGRPRRAFGTVQDVTELKRAEEKLKATSDQLRALSARLQSAREEEAARIAREIHDELGQTLTAIKLEFTALLRDLPAQERPIDRRSQSIVELVDGAIQSIRRIATELRPGILDDLGLAAAVEWVAEEFQARTGTKVHVTLAGDITRDRERATALFRILQETLTNVARHANATQVGVRLAEEDGVLTLEVHDNGQGIAAGQLSAGASVGILGMRERALLLGGRLIINAGPGGGTTVTVRIPEAHRDAEGVTR